MKAVLLYQDVPPDASEDDKDVLVQRDAVSQELKALGYSCENMPVTLDLRQVHDSLLQIKPDVVFNLVESIAGTGRFLYFAPSLLEQLHLPFTGSSSDALYLTTGKVLAKERMALAGLPTPAWSISSQKAPESDPPYIIKPVWEDASVGLDESALVYDRTRYQAVFEQRSKQFGILFAESYIDGREFNLSLLDSETGPEPLPPAEMRFEDYPEGKPRLVDYKAKWESDSFEYTHTVRHFDFPDSDSVLLETLKEYAIKCWQVFDLRGYARVDFRVDSAGNPWILEVNANPCISPDSGFVAATEQAGLPFQQVVARIIAAAR